MASPKRLARIAGILYLLVAIFGGFALAYVYPKIYVAGDAARTAGNVLANAGLIRLGIVADLFQATVVVFVALTLYLLLRHVNKGAASAMLILAAIGSTIGCLNAVFEFEALRVATGAVDLSAFGAAGSNALVLLLVDAQHHGIFVAQVFFGLWLAPLGYLAYQSGWFPRALGVALIAGCVGYLVDLLATFLLPDAGTAIHTVTSILPAIAEVWMVGYLIVKGVRSPVPTDRAPIAPLAQAAIAP